MARQTADPLAIMRLLSQDMSRGFRPMTARDFPPINVWQGANSVAVTAELPGVKPADLDVEVHNDMLTISGERKSPSHEGETRRRSERAFGRFGRLVRLPYRVDRDRVDARFRDGVLEIELHRPEEDLPRRIDVRAG